MAKGSGGSKGGSGNPSPGTTARSAVTGQYVTPKYAATHPKTTVVEKKK
jgi:hypothetical protein